MTLLLSLMVYLSHATPFNRWNLSTKRNYQLHSVQLFCDILTMSRLPNNREKLLPPWDIWKELNFFTQNEEYAKCKFSVLTNSEFYIFVLRTQVAFFLIQIKCWTNCVTTRSGKVVSSTQTLQLMSRKNKKAGQRYSWRETSEDTQHARGGHRILEATASRYQFQCSPRVLRLSRNAWISPALSFLGYW